MEAFYCVGCRFEYPMEKSARITAAVHRDGQAVGFCFICARDISPAAAEPATSSSTRKAPADRIVSA